MKEVQEQKDMDVSVLMSLIVAGLVERTVNMHILSRVLLVAA